MTSISVRMDDALKEAFEAACEDMGMPMAVALTIFAKRVARDRRIPFDVSAPKDPFFSESNLKALEESEQQYRDGKVVVKTMEELEEKAWDEYLDAQSDKALAKRINMLIKEAMRTPFSGRGKPEPLNHGESDVWSRRINDEDRLVYQVEKDAITILKCSGHYDD